VEATSVNLFRKPAPGSKASSGPTIGSGRISSRSSGRYRYLLNSLSSFWLASTTRAAFRSVAARSFLEDPLLTGTNTWGAFSLAPVGSPDVDRAFVVGDFGSWTGESSWCLLLSSQWPRFLFLLACRLGWPREISSWLVRDLSCSRDGSKGGAARPGSERLFFGLGLGSPAGCFRGFESLAKDCWGFESPARDFRGL
jgi:hypothetical protein